MMVLTVFKQGITVPGNRISAIRFSYPNLASSSYNARFVIGQPLVLYYLFHYTGLDATKSVYTIQDLDGDGEITYSGDRKPHFLGQKYFGGLNNSFTYKGLQLDVFFHFVSQNGFKFFNGSMPEVYDPLFGNQLKSVLDDRSKGIIGLALIAVICC